MYSKLIISFTAAVLGVTTASAQDALAASGGEASGNGSYSYTVGQVGYTTSLSSDASASYGVQQAYEVSQVSAIPTLDALVHMSTYPNPTVDQLTIELASMPDGIVTVVLYDVQGKWLHGQRLHDTVSTLDMSTYAPGQYLLRIFINGQEKQTYSEGNAFKIIKR